MGMDTDVPWSIYILYGLWMVMVIPPTSESWKNIGTLAIKSNFPYFRRQWSINGGIGGMTIPNGVGTTGPLVDDVIWGWVVSCLWNDQKMGLQ